MASGIILRHAEPLEPSMGLHLENLFDGRARTYSYEIYLIKIELFARPIY
jgi:hypothetical protein